jgi:hypothetical protein
MRTHLDRGVEMTLQPLTRNRRHHQPHRSGGGSWRYAISRNDIFILMIAFRVGNACRRRLVAALAKRWRLVARRDCSARRQTTGLLALLPRRAKRGDRAEQFTVRVVF